MEYVVALESHVVRFRNAHHEINGQDHFSKHSQKTCACREEQLSNYDTALGKVDSRSLKRKGIIVFSELSINSSGSRRQLRTSEKGEREQKKKETAKGERKERRKERERERESSETRIPLFEASLSVDSISIRKGVRVLLASPSQKWSAYVYIMFHSQTQNWVRSHGF